MSLLLGCRYFRAWIWAVHSDFRIFRKHLPEHWCLSQYYFLGDGQIASRWEGDRVLCFVKCSSECHSLQNGKDAKFTHQFVLQNWSIPCFVPFTMHPVWRESCDNWTFKDRLFHLIKGQLWPLNLSSPTPSSSRERYFVHCTETTSTCFNPRAQTCSSLQLKREQQKPGVRSSSRDWLAFPSYQALELSLRTSHETPCASKQQVENEFFKKMKCEEVSLN